MKGLWHSDARLVDAVLAGDEDAWRKFILLQSNFIYRAIVRYTDDYDEKMSVYLHVLEKLREDRFARLRRFSFQSKLSTWLTVVARRLALDFLRSRYGRDFALKRIRVVPIDGEPDYTRILADMRTPEAELEGQEKRALRQRLEAGLGPALARLEERERLAVQLVYFQGMRINEAARLLRLPSGYKYLARVLRKLRAELEGGRRLDRGEIADALQGEPHE